MHTAEYGLERVRKVGLAAIASESGLKGRRAVMVGDVC